MIWGTTGPKIGIDSLRSSIERWRENPSLLKDVIEIIDWRLSSFEHPIQNIIHPFPCWLKLHAHYGSDEIKAALGLCSLTKAGSKGVGVMHNRELKVYIHLITFNKEDKDFSPTTRYRDYPISRTRLHWESQSQTTQSSETGQNHLFFKERGYNILIFARMAKSSDGATCPFQYLGPTSRVLKVKGNQPISMTWELEYPMPAQLFEEGKTA